MSAINPLPISAESIRVLAARNITLGFDGFIDAIVRVIRSKTKSETTYFQTIKEFGEYTVDRSAGNFALELREVFRKPGGNMPIMALALSGWVGRVNCIGALGFPTINPLFADFPDNCSLYSFAEPGITTALEFNDGKIIMGEMSQLNAANWQTLKDILGLDLITDAFRNTELIAMVNWSELDHASEIWRGVQDEVLPRISYPSKPFAFFDLADCSKKSGDEIRGALELIGNFSQWFRVTLGLNKNEAEQIHGVMSNGSVTDNMNVIGDEIFAHVNAETLVIHFHTTALAWSRAGTFVKETPRITNPVLSTGAGDNFNAGYCVGLLADMKVDACLELGHAFASYYMVNGKSIRSNRTKSL